MFKSTFISCLALLVLSTNVMASNLIIRGEVDMPDGPKINFTVPVDVLEAIKTSGLSALVNNKEKLNGIVDSLIGDLASVNGKSLVNINMDKHGVSVIVDEVDEDQPEEANFIQLNVSSTEDDVPDINLRIPKGVVYLAAFIGNQFMEKHGEELMDIIKQKIEMHHKPPVHHEVHTEMSKPVNNPKAVVDKVDPLKLQQEIRKEIMKEIDPEKIVKEILKEILKEQN